MWIEYLRIASKVLRAHKFRSSLTVLSITIGAFSIVLMSSLAQSGLTTLSRGVEDLGGARLIAVWAQPPERAEYKLVSYSEGITSQDRDVLFSSLPHVVGRTMYSQIERKDVVGDTGTAWRTDVIGGDGDFLTTYKMRLARGRGFTEAEDRQRARVCVVGHKLAEEVFAGDAVGHQLSVDGVRCRVVGQLANQDRWGVNMGFDWLDLVVLPLHTLADADAKVMPAAQILVKTDAASSNEVVKRIINALLSARHHDVDDFKIYDFSGFMDKFHATFAIMETLVGLIAGIALLVGGVGVMNMMLVSVSERVREIGIRKALGASPSDIGAQFLCEAIVLSGFGGCIGVAGGVALALVSGPLIQHFKPSWVAVISHGAVAAAFLVSVGIGILFGYFPARRAARLDAILAIRR